MLRVCYGFRTLHTFNPTTEEGGSLCLRLHRETQSERKNKQTNKTHTHTTLQWNCSPEIKTASAVLNKVKLGSTVLEAEFPGQNLNRQWAIQSKLPNCRGKIHLFEWRPQIGGQTLHPLLVIQHITTGKRQCTLKGASSETKLVSPLLYLLTHSPRVLLCQSHCRSYYMGGNCLSPSCNLG